jgi:hypothetical protein
MDASIRDWLEGRGGEVVLISLTDDATSRVLTRFYRAATTESHLDLLGRWPRKSGRPAALYTDRHGIFEPQVPGPLPEVSGSQRQVTRLGAPPPNARSVARWRPTPGRGRALAPRRGPTHPAYSRPSGARVALLRSPILPTAGPSRGGVQPKITPGATGASPKSDTALSANYLLAQYKLRVWGKSVGKPGSAGRRGKSP